MKLFILIVLLQSFALSFANSQTSTDSVEVKQSQTIEKKKEMEKSKTQQKQRQTPEQPLKGFVDENGDGIDDRLQAVKGKSQAQHGTQLQHDRFIDMDGDGINDNRCGGMGIAPKNTEVPGHGKHH